MAVASGTRVGLDNTAADHAVSFQLQREKQHVFMTPIVIAIPRLFFYVQAKGDLPVKVSCRIHYIEKSVSESVKLRTQMDQETGGTVQSTEQKNRCIC